MLKLTVFTLAISALLNSATSTGDRGCVKAHQANIDNNFLEGNFIILKHSDTEMFNRIDKSFEFIGKPVIAKSLCWESTGILKDGSPHKVHIKCEYTNPSDLNCALTKEEQERFLNAKGNVVVTATDNSTYIAGITCVSGRASYWWIASTTGAQIDSGVEKRILGEFRRVGMDINNIAVEKKSLVTIKEFYLQKGNC